MIDLQTLATIVAMAGSTYLTRIIGYLALRNRTLGSRTRKLLDNVPGCVLVSMIAPAFVPRNPADTIALAVTLLAALRLSLLPTVLIGIGATALSRHYLLYSTRTNKSVQRCCRFGRRFRISVQPPPHR